MTGPVRHPPLADAEIVLGLVYGAGTDIDPVNDVLRGALESWGYRLHPVHLSDAFPTLLGRAFNPKSPDATRQLQDMGDELRQKLGHQRALAQLSAYLVAEERQRLDSKQNRTAWEIRSLRRPEEVEELRRIYGARFILIGVHVPEGIRLRTASNRRRRWSPTTSAHFDVDAIEDLRRDEDDPSLPYGQAMRRTFSLADFFVDARSPTKLKQTLERVIQLIFEEPFMPPTRDEHAMYLAYAAALRSAEMGKQVGAAIMAASGDVLAVGTNEVPSGKGGLYWSPDEPDGRDFVMEPPVDSNTEWQRRVTRELLVRMAEQGWLAEGMFEKTTRCAQEGGREIEKDSIDVPDDKLDIFLNAVQSTRFSALTEFGRAVHAEMDALTTATRHGVRIEGAQLVCTTYPCHNCTRHIIGSGIRRVVYLHPYVKSLARELHDDSIVLDPVEEGLIDGKVVFEQYIGVAPRGYPQYFDFGHVERKRSDGRALSVTNRDQQLPRVLRNADSFGFGGPVVPVNHHTRLERNVVQHFRHQILTTDGLNIPTHSS
jgi:deoxycytidylate deaminase